MEKLGFMQQKTKCDVIQNKFSVVQKEERPKRYERSYFVRKQDIHMGRICVYGRARNGKQSQQSSHVDKVMVT